MLQQTQAKTVIPYYNRFLECFPDIASLASAPEQEVMALWAGLGYYGRAGNLQKAARQIMESHGGTFPTEFRKILALPGIGRYTAGAVCSIAFNQPQPIVDGNIRRVVTRLNGITQHVPDSYFWNQMLAWIPDKEASVFNQAMMELGALVCIPSSPRCHQCPVRRYCRAWKSGIQKSIPQARVKQKIERVEMAVLVLERGEQILVARQSRGFIPGKWGLPIEILHAQEEPLDATARLSRRISKGAIRPRFVAQLHHSISNHRISAHVFCGKTSRFASRLRQSSRLRWIDHSDVSVLLTSSLFRKALRSCGMDLRDGKA